MRRRSDAVERGHAAAAARDRRRAGRRLPALRASASRDRYALGGFVRNDPQGVLMEVEGARVDDFVAALRREPPPLARIDSLECETHRAAARRDILDRAEPRRPQRERASRPTPPSANDCLDDLFDPQSRFYLYPFINCTHCGPRYTLTRRLPYDRAQTSMAPFAMCEDCARDYADPDEPALSRAADRLPEMRPAPDASRRRDRRQRSERPHCRAQRDRRLSSSLRRAQREQRSRSCVAARAATPSLSP